MATRYHWYFIRIHDKGVPIATRCERALGPRQACQMAFGVVYDREGHEAQYLDIGGRKPNALSQKRKVELLESKDWKPIPKTGL